MNHANILLNNCLMFSITLSNQQCSMVSLQAIGQSLKSVAKHTKDLPRQEWSRVAGCMFIASDRLETIAESGVRNTTIFGPYTKYIVYEYLLELAVIAKSIAYELNRKLLALHS